MRGTFHLSRAGMSWRRDRRDEAIRSEEAKCHRSCGATQVPEFFEVNSQPSDLSERIRWMDRVGIDYAVVNSGGFPATYPLIADLGERQAFNDDGSMSDPTR
jgi:hypothetical protein